MGFINRFFVIWSTFILVTSFIKFILYRVKKKGRAYDSFKKNQIILCAAILLLVVNIVFVANIMFSMTGAPAEIIPHHVQCGIPIFGTMTMTWWGIIAANGVISAYDIFIVLSRHCGVVYLLSKM